MGSHDTKDLDSPMPMSRSKTTASALCSEFSRFFPEGLLCDMLDLWKRFVICYWNPMLPNLNVHLKWTIFEDRCSRQQAISRGTVWESRRRPKGLLVGHAIHVFTAALNRSDLSGLPKITPKALTELGKHPGKSHYCKLWFFNPLCPRCSQLERKPCNTAVSIYHTFLAVRSAHFPFSALGEAERFVI